MRSEETIILVGGGPTAGKSTMAQRLAKHLDLPWMSTDHIRDIARFVARREDHPKLFNPEEYDAERFLTEFSSQEIANMEFEQGDALWPIVRQFIENEYTFESGFILEGVHILPNHVAKLQKQHGNIRGVFLIDDDEARIRNVIYTRGLWGDADSYPDSVKEKEIEWVQAFNKRLQEEAEKLKLPLVAVNKHEDDLQTVLSVLKLNALE